jgi:chromosome segregation ATPase
MNAVEHLLKQRLERIERDLTARESEQKSWEDAVEECKAEVFRLKMERSQIEDHLESLKEAA